MTILRSSVNAFFLSFAKVLGFFLALLFGIMIIGGLSSIKGDFPEKSFEITVRPNADGSREFFSKKSTILEVNIEGIIGMRKLNQDKIREMLVEAREGQLKDGLVKAIFLNINTPGGTVIDSDGIYRLLKAFKEEHNTPIYAYINGLCASGGMYIACAADKIYASNPSIIGSVGVVLPTFMNFSEPLKNFGVQTLTISEGKDKDQMNPLRPWKEGESDNLKLVTSHYYNQFVDIVSTARPKLTKEKLMKEFGAQIYPAEIAAEYGYIDVPNASRRDALLALANEANIAEEYQVISMEKDNWLQDLFQSNALFNHRIEIPGTLPSDLQGQFLFLSL